MGWSVAGRARRGRARRPRAYLSQMPARIVLMALFLGSTFSAQRVGARADDRVFDPHYWAHPHYIVPSYDFRPPPKPADDETERRAEIARDRRGAPAQRKPPPRSKR